MFSQIFPMRNMDVRNVCKNILLMSLYSLDMPNFVFPTFQRRPVAEFFIIADV
jgi:hypothetical protein